MKHVKLSILLLSLAILIPCTVLGQFEGKMTFTQYEMEQSNSSGEQTKFTLFFASDRILVQGNNEYEVAGSIKSDGILFRMDFEDMVLFADDNTGIKISRSDIDAVKNMFGEEGNSNSSANELDDIDYELTGKTSHIQGYLCEQFIFRDQEDDEEYMEVWMTKDLQTDLSSILDMTQGLITGENFHKKLITDGYFPLKASFYSGGEHVGLIEATEISETSVARGMVQIPSGVKVFSFQEYLFQRFSQQ